jgi:uncharacterized protein involved in exopolysaccharide biosynthesis
LIKLRLPNLTAGAGSPSTLLAEPYIPQHFVHPGLSLMQITAVIRSYWKQSAIIVLTVAVFALVLVKSLPKTYTATATLIINSESKDPLAGQEFPQAVLGNYVATQTELMLSHIVLSPVLNQLDLLNDKTFTAGAGNVDIAALREYVAAALIKSLQVETGRGGHLLYISASLKDPVRAAQVANAVADVYLAQERRRVNDPAGERAERYSTQLAELRAKAVAAQDKVTEFRKKNGITDVAAANAGTEVQALVSLETRLLEAQNLRRSLESKQAGRAGSADEALASDSVKALRTQMSAEETSLAQLSSTLGPRHPKVLELQSQMKVTRRALAREMQQLTENVSTEITRAKDLEAKLTAAVAEQRTKVLHLREIQDDGAKLTLELDSAQAVYKRALDGYDQILFASVGNYSNVSFISRAVPPVKASKPNKPKLFTLGILFALAAGLAAPLIYELGFHRRVRCRDDIEREFAIPVLAHFDYIPALAGPS